MADRYSMCNEWLPCHECGRALEPYVWQMVSAPTGLWAVCEWEDSEDLEDYPVVAIITALAPVTTPPVSEYCIEKTFYLLAGLQHHELEGWAEAKYIKKLVLLSD